MNRLFFVIFFTLSLVRGEFQLEVTEGQREPLQMAMVLQTSSSSEQDNLSKELSKIIHLDLQSTGLFQFSDPNTFLEKSIPLNNQPRFVDWRLIHVQFVINLEINITETGKVRISYRLWDALTEQLLISSTLETELHYQRRLAHLVADAIYSRLTGEAGYFDTRIIYVTEEAKGLKQKKRLAIMDQDGKNHKYLTSGEHIVLTPRFSPNLQRITYLSYEKKIPHVYVYDLETGKHELVGAFPGMTFAPRFGPNEKDLVMSQAVGGRTDIYHIDLNTRRFKKLTHGNWIDTSPCYDPKGEKIVFNSDRGGTKQIYVMDKKGRDVKRISFGSGTYSTPVWSPRGDYIAFTKTDKRNFYIGVMRPDGSGERLISTGYIVEGPTWAPNGRTLMFARTDKKPGKQANPSWVYAIDITGFNERRIKTPQYASDPAWSAPLPKS